MDEWRPISLLLLSVSMWRLNCAKTGSHSIDELVTSCFPAKLSSYIRQRFQNKVSNTCSCGHHPSHIRKDKVITIIKSVSMWSSSLVSCRHMRPQMFLRAEFSVASPLCHLNLKVTNFMCISTFCCLVVCNASASMMTLLSTSVLQFTPSHVSHTFPRQRNLLLSANMVHFHKLEPSFRHFEAPCIQRVISI